MKERTQRFDPRQSMHRPDFEIFHYQEATPSDVEVHHHDFYEVYFFLSGKVEFRIEGRIYHLQPGDVMLINPMELHQLIVENEQSQYERIVLWVEKSYLERLSTPEVSLTRCFDNALPNHTNLLRPTPSQRMELMVRLQQLHQENYANDYGSRLYSHSILVQFMIELNRMAYRAVQTPAEAENESPLVTRVVGYIGDHYNEDLSLDELAQQFYVSKYHLSHEFSRVMGVSIYRYITLKRLVVAKQMLSSGIAPGVVYTNCGFSDYANFYRAFKTQYGITPRACAAEAT